MSRSNKIFSSFWCGLIISSCLLLLSLCIEAIGQGDEILGGHDDQDDEDAHLAAGYKNLRKYAEERVSQKTGLKKDISSEDYQKYQGVVKCSVCERVVKAMGAKALSTPFGMEVKTHRGGTKEKLQEKRVYARAHEIVDGLCSAKDVGKVVEKEMCQFVVEAIEDAMIQYIVETPAERVLEAIREDKDDKKKKKNPKEEKGVNSKEELAKKTKKEIIENALREDKNRLKSAAKEELSDLCLPLCDFKRELKDKLAELQKSVRFQFHRSIWQELWDIYTNHYLLITGVFCAVATFCVIVQMKIFGRYEGNVKMKKEFDRLRELNKKYS